MSGDTLRSRRRPAGRLLAIAALLTACAVPAAAAPGWKQVESLFRDARYEEASRIVADLSRRDRGSAEALFWRARLETEPAAALAAMRTGLARAELPAPLRARFALEIAGIEFARGRHPAALEALDQLRRLQHAPLAGDAAFWADACARAIAQPAGRPPATRAQPARPAAAAPPGDNALARTPREPAAPVRPGRVAWSLQLGAFTDNARARSFLVRVRADLQGVELLNDRDPDGGPVYKVRYGLWRDRDEAAAVARRLRKQLGIEAIVVEAAARP